MQKYVRFSVEYLVYLSIDVTVCNCVEGLGVGVDPNLVLYSRIYRSTENVTAMERWLTKHAGKGSTN
jgi:hypothetical protein